MAPGEGRPSLVHVVDGVSPAGGSAPGRLEVGAGYLELFGPGEPVRMSGVRGVEVVDDAVVVTADGPGPTRLALADERSRARGRPGLEAFASDLREFLGLPALEAPTVRVAALAWGMVAAGFGGGFLAAVALGGGGLVITDFFEAVYQGGFLALGALALARLMGRRARVPGLVPWVLAAASISAGALMGVSGAPELAEAGPDDLHQLFGTPQAIAGEVLLAVAVALALVLSFRRFPRLGPSAFSREQRAEGRRNLALAGIIVGFAVAAAVVARLVAPVDGGGSEVAGRGGTVAATLRDFTIALGPASAAPGSVTFEIRNDGPSAHQFWVYRTELPPGSLPVDLGLGRVNEFGEGYVAKAFFFEDIPPGGSKTLEIDVEAGRYEVMCNIPAHYGRGMFATLTVA